MRVAFILADITDDAKKVNIILTHIPTKYFYNLVSLFAPTPSDLSLYDLKKRMTAIFNPPQTIVKNLAEFQDRVKQKSESYS